jgi:hypothetical protein
VGRIIVSVKGTIKDTTAAESRKRSFRALEREVKMEGLGVGWEEVASTGVFRDAAISGGTVSGLVILGVCKFDPYLKRGKKDLLELP